VVCVEGTGETADGLFDLASSGKFKERPSQARRVSNGAELDGCNLLYIAASEASRLSRVLSMVGNKPVLTVSDASGFADQGVLINLYQQDRRLRFEINLAAARRTRLVFSSKLLRLGRLVGAPAPPDAGDAAAGGG
jgi:hypothetical protein